MNAAPESASASSRPPPARRAFVFAGGGTGGHIYPALAVIEQLRRADPEVVVHILCSDRPNDSVILRDAGVPFAPLPAKAMILRPRGFIRFFANWGPSVRRTRQLIRSLKNTHASVVLVAMGGFVAAPAARAGHREHVPVVLVNLDAVPGKANELIARKAATVWSTTEVEGHPDWLRVRPIVRAGILQARSPGPAREAFGLDPDTRTLLITGGSTGATSINGFITACLKARPGEFAGWQVIHQVGTQISEEQIGRIRAAYLAAGVRAWVERSITDMGSAYAAADLGVGRSGAGSVAECWAARLPSVLLPYPHHRDRHQLHNARVLTDAGAARTLDDRIDPGANLRAHGQALLGLLTDPAQREAMRAGFEGLGRPDGAETIARALLRLA